MTRAAAHSASTAAGRVRRSRIGASRRAAQPRVLARQRPPPRAAHPDQAYTSTPTVYWSGGRPHCPEGGLDPDPGHSCGAEAQSSLGQAMGQPMAGSLSQLDGNRKAPFHSCEPPPPPPSCVITLRNTAHGAAETKGVTVRIYTDVRSRGRSCMGRAGGHLAAINYAHNRHHTPVECELNVVC